MRVQQYISSIAVVLCVADKVTGHITPGTPQVQRSVVSVYEDEQTAEPVVSNWNDADSVANTDDKATKFAAQPGNNKRESNQLSSSQSVAAASHHKSDAKPSTTTIHARQEDEAEPVPTQDPNVLPIEPKITPAIGIAGAIMLGTGVALCLVGIKRVWLHNFLSTAYLASLAVTVLIIYVMNPDHSNAIQGAYVVAAVVTGLIFGSVSLVFQEVTEGLGCMLGSFCFAMWILVLAPGGIIHSTAGRGILIGVITVVGFALSFSHHTRMYALLCCTSFAGATITILGADCFSRAGLKEFWLYLWNLNDKQFPLETNTYPITRGIRVEIACIVVVFLLGLVSQFKLWKVIKARRSKNEEDRKNAENERLEAEAAIGRDIEANNERERAEWEASYGEKGGARVHIDSGVGSSVETFGKDQYSVREREVDPNELSDIMERESGRNSHSENGSISGEHRVSAIPEGVVEMGERSGRTSLDSSRKLQNSSNESQEDLLKNNDRGKAYVAGAPEVVPLPFRVPTGEGEQDQENELDGKTEGTAILDSVAPNHGVAIPLQKLSLQRLNEQFAADVPQSRDDNASSVAANADDIAALDDISPGQQSNRHSVATLSALDAEHLAPPKKDHAQSRPTSVASEIEMEEAVEEDDEEALHREPVIIDQTATPVTGQLSKKSSSATNRERRLSNATKTSKTPASSDGHPASVSEHLVEQLPAKLSKIALTYRTNEWAKHIADADHPEHGEELERPSSPGVQVDTNFPEEVAKPVDVEALQQTNFSNDPVVPVPTHTPSKASKKSKRNSRQSEPGSTHSRRTSTQSVTPVHAFGRSPSQQSTNPRESISASPVKPKHGSVRKTSMPLTNQTLVESPIEDAPETFQYNDFARNADPQTNPLTSASASNLLDERNNMLQRRPTSTSFNGFRSTPALVMMSGAIPEGEATRSPEQGSGFISPTQSSPTLPTFEDENMTLSQRRSLMQSSNLQQQATTTTTTTPTHKPRPSIYSTLAYDSHQPARHPSTTSVQQSARLNQWRQTLEADVQAKQPPRAVETNARQNMMDDRRQSEMRHAKRKEEESRRQSAIDEAMRRGQLDGAHRDAMRKMQAKANREGA
ncbi:hypothetical protein Q7P35_007528 [Cladosporium inversicolor]